MRLNDGDEIEFGKGDDENTIELPDPRFCNLHLAIAWVSAACGYAEVVDRFRKDWEDWEDWEDDESGQLADEVQRQLLFNAY
jgi:hypothetical protein